MKENAKRINRIADVHCHILPGLDDGSKNMDMTMDMLRVAMREGITHIVCTPHYKAGRHNASNATIEKRFEEVREMIEEAGIPIQLFLGNEVLFFDNIDEKLDAKRIYTMNHCQYVLVEFSPGDQYNYIRNALIEVQGMGYSPVIAHVERYECMVKHPEYAGELHSMGVKIQVNASSVMGEIGWRIKHYIKRLMKDHIVDYVGTDAHRSEGRAPYIDACAEYLYKKFDTQYVNDILYENARRDFLLE